jgi:uncharacterized repeat protein (TIGR03803 family)
MQKRTSVFIFSLFVALLLIIVPTTSAQTFDTVVKFNYADGANPAQGPLVLATNGNFFGTTLNGTSRGDDGTIFELAPSGQLRVIYKFCQQSGCSDGRNPFGGVTQIREGNFVGATTYGGLNNGGTVFEVTRAGILTTLYSFCQHTDRGGFCTDGEFPIGGGDSGDERKFVRHNF